MGRRPYKWGRIALTNPEALMEAADSLPENLRDIPAKRKKLVSALIEEHGGPAQITAKEAVLIDRIGRIWPYLELSDREALDTGQPGIRPGDYAALYNAFVRSLQALDKIAGTKRSGAGTDTFNIERYLGQRARPGSPGPPKAVVENAEPKPEG